MTNNKQQTAVEWYIEKLLDLDYEYAKGLITLGVWSERKNSLIQQAKAMHKEEIIQAWKKGDGQFDKVSDKMSLDYYEQTYGGGEQ